MVGDDLGIAVASNAVRHSIVPNCVTPGNNLAIRVSACLTYWRARRCVTRIENSSAHINSVQANDTQTISLSKGQFSFKQSESHTCILIKTSFCHWSASLIHNALATKNSSVSLAKWFAPNPAVFQRLNFKPWSFFNWASFLTFKNLKTLHSEWASIL